MKFVETPVSFGFMWPIPIILWWDEVTSFWSRAVGWQVREVSWTAYVCDVCGIRCLTQNDWGPLSVPTPPSRSVVDNNSSAHLCSVAWGNSCECTGLNMKLKREAVESWVRESLSVMSPSNTQASGLASGCQYWCREQKINYVKWRMFTAAGGLFQSCWKWGCCIAGLLPGTTLRVTVLPNIPTQSLCLCFNVMDATSADCLLLGST